MSFRLKPKLPNFRLGISMILICAFLTAAFVLSTLQNLEASIFATPSSTGVDSAQGNAFLDAMTVNTDTISTAQAVLPLATATQKQLTEANNTNWLSLATQMTRFEYATQCKALMDNVEVPDLKCLEGERIPITVDEVEKYSPQDKCDNPGHLKGDCTPFSRFLNLPGTSDVTTVAVCRKYPGRDSAYYRETDPRFQDIAVIQHNRRTGDTCWFQSPPGSDRNGTLVPSPMKASATSADWLEPSGIQNGNNCQECHDADPFIWTPYIGQVVGPTPPTWDRKGLYKSNSLGLFGNLPQHTVFEPKNNACVQCHRIGSNSRWLFEYSISDPPHPKDKDGHPWMPPSDVNYQTAIEQLNRCFDSPTLPECNAHLPSEECLNGAVYVDGTNTGAQQGTTTKPFKTVYNAARAACVGAELHIKRGTYFEALTISKPLRLVAESGTATLFGSGSTNVIVAPDTPTAITSNDGGATVQIPPSSGINTVNVGAIAIDTSGSTLPAGSAPRSPVYDVSGFDQNSQPVNILPGQLAIDISYIDGGVAAAGIAAETDLNVYRRTRNGDGSYSSWAAMLPCAGCVQDTTANKFTVQTNQLGQFTVLEAVAAMRIAPPALNFTMVQSGTNPSTQTLAIEKEGTGSLDWSTIELLPWLTLSLEAGSGPASIQISINSGGLTPGIYTGTIYIVQGAREIAIPVTLTVQASGTTPSTSQLYLPLVVR